MVDKRVKNGNDSKTKENEAEPKMDEVKSKEPELKHKEPELIQKESEPISTEDKPSVMDISTDDEIHEYSDTEPPENQLFKDKVFFLNEDLSATDVIKLKTQITTMSGRVTERASKAGYVITTGKKLPQNILKTTEVLTALWVSECHEIGGLIPTTRYKIKSN